MKSLQQLLERLEPIATSGDLSVSISGITADSRAVKPGFLFVAVKGTQSDGHNYIQSALEKGAVAILTQQAIDVAVPSVLVENSAFALGMVASAFHDYPSEKLTLSGVTGTNGKTTVATLLFNTFRKLGYSCGLLSTVENRIDGAVIPSTHTTPDPVALNALLGEMVSRGVSYAFMEVSSHAIHQYRIAGLKFKVALFTNLTHDHLDYHGTFAEYLKAKKMWFDGLSKDSVSIVNKDDKNGMVMVQNTRASIKTYSLVSTADFKGKLISNSLEGLELEVNGVRAMFRLSGKFNAYNLLAVYGAAITLDQQAEEVLAALSAAAPARGRMETVASAKDRVLGIVDYAHTPDALKNVLDTITAMKRDGQKLITLVGCGGNRDTAKRPIMAAMACSASDKTILTSDNPRFEKPSDILDQMMTGVKEDQLASTLRIEDRREAIRTAVMLANAGDIILVAGKGHETYQEIEGEKHPFDDREELMKAFQTMNR